MLNPAMKTTLKFQHTHTQRDREGEREYQNLERHEAISGMWSQKSKFELHFDPSSAFHRTPRNLHQCVLDFALVGGGHWGRDKWVLESEALSKLQALKAILQPTCPISYYSPLAKLPQVHSVSDELMMKTGSVES